MRAEFVPLFTALMTGATAAASAAVWLYLKLRRELAPRPVEAAPIILAPPVREPPILIPD